MAQPRVLILRAPGTNCDQETAYAFGLAGAAAERLHVNRLLENPRRLDEFQILCVPGGFSYGDDLSAGRILAHQIQRQLADEMARFEADDKLVLGICNGFQVLIKSGLLLEPVAGRQVATLDWNDSGRFEDRWVQLGVEAGKCEFLSGVESMYLPIAHAEGKFVARDPDSLAALDDAGQLVLRYAAHNGSANSTVDGLLPYPENPNGSQAAVAGVASSNGRVLGLMPHPERFVERTQHPRWTRQDLPKEGDGLAVFRNAVRYFA